MSQLGKFSLSLAVKDIDASLAFYEKLGFVVFGGDAQQGWLMLKNGDQQLGLFQGMFEHNIMTFNPGSGQAGEELDTYTDIRELQKDMVAAGIEVSSLIESESGPASFMVTDPDGNSILIDQHH